MGGKKQNKDSEAERTKSRTKLKASEDERASELPRLFFFPLFIVRIFFRPCVERHTHRERKKKKERKEKKKTMYVKVCVCVFERDEESQILIHLCFFVHLCLYFFWEGGTWKEGRTERKDCVWWAPQTFRLIFLFFCFSFGIPAIFGGGEG